MIEKQPVMQLNIRIPHALAQALEELATAEHLEKIDIARQILWDGVAQRKQTLALKLHAEGKVTKTRAAEIAGLSVWEIVDLVEKHGLRWDYSVEDAKEEIAAVVKQARQHKR